MPATTDPPTGTDWPLYWFALLEHAVERGDHGAAAEAQRVLNRMGVRVNYGRPQTVTVRPTVGVARA